MITIPMIILMIMIIVIIIITSLPPCIERGLTLKSYQM